MTWFYSRLDSWLFQILFHVQRDRRKFPLTFSFLGCASPFFMPRFVTHCSVIVRRHWHCPLHGAATWWSPHHIVISSCHWMIDDGQFRCSAVVLYIVNPFCLSSSVQIFFGKFCGDLKERNFHLQSSWSGLNLFYVTFCLPLLISRISVNRRTINNVLEI